MPVVRHTLAMVLLAGAASSLHAQAARASRTPSKPAPTSSSSTRTGGASPGATSRGAYTTTQAARGALAYRSNCASCHAATAYTGASFRQLWVGRKAYDMVSLLRQTMPNDDPGRLTKQQYVDIVAYLFQLNGYPAGGRALPSDDAGLKRVAIDSPGVAAP